MKLWNRIRQALLQNPSQTLCERNAAMTYKELAAFAERFAKRLKGERCCAILCRSEMAAAMGLLRLLCGGVTAVRCRCGTARRIAGKSLISSVRAVSLPTPTEN